MESKWLDSESCASFRISALDSINVLDSESALDSVDSKFLRVVFSRILSNFSNLLFAQKEKGFIPSPRTLKAPKRIKRRVFAALCLQPVGSFAQPQSISFGGSASLSPCLVKNAKNALLHFFNAFLTPRQGRVSVGAIAPPH